jgi:hypothetical protein
MLKKLTPYLLFLLLASSQAFGQATSSCTQTLRFAQSTYESGKLHELEAILNEGNCLKDGFNTEERRQAYKLLVQSYIYLEEPEKADAAMLSLLTTDQFFKPNEDVDPAEFVSLYNRFRTKPLFRYGVKLGPAFNTPFSTSDYYVGSAAPGSSKFSPLVTFTMGVMFEKDFLKSFRLTLAPEVAFSSRGFSEQWTNFNTETGEESTDGELALKIKSIDFNPLVKWWLAKEPEKRDQKLEPFVIGGPGVNFVFDAVVEDAKLDHSLFRQGTNTGPSIDVSKNCDAVNFSAIVGGGARIRLSQVFVSADVRFNFGLNNVINDKDRTNDELAFDYSWSPNATYMNSITVNLALQLAYFNPQKLIK